LKFFCEESNPRHKFAKVALEACIGPCDLAVASANSDFRGAL